MHSSKMLAAEMNSTVLSLSKKEVIIVKGQRTAFERLKKYIFD